jgi:IS5 family transposase
LGLQLCDTVPDAKTIWLFKEELNTANILDTVFYRFVELLEKKGIITSSGSIVDATFVDVPKQRNMREENKEIKEGKTPPEWEGPDNRHKKAQKDVDARWATKNKETHYGYKNHVNVGKKSKIITKYTATSAEVHDSQELKNLINKKKDKRIYGDSAYTGGEVQSGIPATMQNRIHEKGYRDHPLTKNQIRTNTAKSHIRVRVEHVFAAINHFGGIYQDYRNNKGKISDRAHESNIYLTRYTYLMEANT